MSAYEPSLFVEPLGYQPVEFLDIPPMSESHEEWIAPSDASPAAEGRLMAGAPIR